MDDDQLRRLLARVVDDDTRWAAVMALRPDGDDYGDVTSVTDQRRLIHDLALMPMSDDDPGPGGGLIAEMADPTSVYDAVGMLCREVLRLRLELDELRGHVGLSPN